MSGFFEFIKYNLKEYKSYWICEGIIIFGTICFIFKLNSYNKILFEIQSQYSNDIIKALEVVREPFYFNYLLFGGLVIAILIGYIMLVLKRLRWVSIPIIVINIILLIVFFIVYWNPILAIFAVLLSVCGLFGVASS